MEDPKCICKGNWRAIVSESEPFIDRLFKDESDGSVYNFFGVVHGEDDYYYGMINKEKGLKLLSCVGSLDGHNFTLLPTNTEETE